MVNFGSKLSNFRYRGNKSQSWFNLTDITQLPNLENTSVGARV